MTEHYTNPPKRYTESSLLSQMERAGNKDMNAGARRPGDVGFARTGKLITVLPDEIKSVQMTVDMENTLAAVSAGTVTDTSYFTPETIEDYSYTDKDNKEHYGKQFKFKMEFLQRKK